jgi:hypothetical protein
MNLYTRVPDKGRVANSVSMNASFNQAMTSSTPYTVFYVERMKQYAICCDIAETSAALAGTLKLQASNNAYTDNTDLIDNPDAVWVDIPSSSVTLTTGSTQTFWNAADVGYEAVRIVWTRTSGQGTLKSYFLAKA